jgi:hypothetical protein
MKVRKPTSKVNIQRGMPSMEIAYFPESNLSQEF